MNYFRPAQEPLRVSMLEEAVMITMQEKERYGLEIIEMVSFASNGCMDINYGSLYPLLKRLTRKGLLVSTKVSEDIAIRGGHSRKYYRLTSLGRMALSETEQFRRNLREWKDK